MAISGANLVTSPELDSRLTILEARINADMKDVKAELIRWVFVVMLGNVALGACATAIVNTLQHFH